MGGGVEREDVSGQPERGSPSGSHRRQDGSAPRQGWSSGPRRGGVSPRVSWLLVPVGAVLGLGVALLWSLLISPVYQSTELAFVALKFPPEEVGPFSAAQFVTQRIDSYAHLATTPDALAAVAADLGGRDVSEVQNTVFVEAIPGTVLLRVTAEAGDARTAARTADSVTSNLRKSVALVEGTDGGATSPVEIVPVQPPIATGDPTETSTSMKLLIGLLAGTGVGGAVHLGLTGLTAARRRRGEAPQLQSPRAPDQSAVSTNHPNI